MQVAADNGNIIAVQKYLRRLAQLGCEKQFRWKARILLHTYRWRCTHKFDKRSKRAVSKANVKTLRDKYKQTDQGRRLHERRFLPDKFTKKSKPKSESMAERKVESRLVSWSRNALVKLFSFKTYDPRTYIHMHVWVCQAFKCQPTKVFWKPS